MTKIKRYSPLIILFNIGKLVRNSFFFVIYLYVLKAGSDSLVIKYGRIAFLLIVGIAFLSIIYQWFTHKYSLDDRSFHIYKGLFNKSERTVPFSKIQNINRHTSLFHRLVNMTSLHFDTGMDGEDATITFHVISLNEADRMEAHLKHANEDPSIGLSHEDDDSDVAREHDISNRKIHFQPTKKDTLKASFTTFSFLVFILLIASVYYKINEVFNVEDTAEGFLKNLIRSWWLLTLIVIILIIASVAFGMIKTYIKYGKYEISSDSNYIYINKGVIDETTFSISKERVQAIEVSQPLAKRLLGLAEVKLTSAGSSGSEENAPEINTLYPFLPVNKAYELIMDILPSYKISKEMIRLPKKAIWLRILRPSWFWLLVTSGLWYFKPIILDVKEAWVILSATLFLYIFIVRLLDSFHTRYLIKDQFVQFKKGAWTTSLFVAKREKVIEVKVTRSFVQKMLGLASIETTNRGKPVHHSGVEDIPVEEANSFLQWYVDRKNEIKVE